MFKFFEKEKYFALQTQFVSMPSFKPEILKT